jgi:hypothetical protein
MIPVTGRQTAGNYCIVVACLRANLKQQLKLLRFGDKVEFNILLTRHESARCLSHEIRTFDTRV